METKDIPTAISLHHLYRDYVKNEDSLINYRTTWLITIQSILFGIYGLTLQKNADILATLMTNPALGTTREAKEKAISAMISDHNSHFGSSISSLRYIIDWTPIFGIFFCVVFTISIFAAYMTCSRVQLHAGKHAEIFKDISLPGITGGGAFGIPFLGSILSFFVPISITFFWFFARFIVWSR